MTVTAIAIGSEEWLEARRRAISATDIPIILGLSPWASEADLADEKQGIAPPRTSTVRMRIGSLLEPLIAELYTERTGRSVERWESLAIHPTVTWAVASPDFVAADRLVETKRYARSAVADGLPQHVEAQVQWQMGVTGIHRADVAVLAGDELLEPFELAFDEAAFNDLLAIAADFRRRLEAGGPFAVNADRIKRQYPDDDGGTMVADADLDAAVRELVAARNARHALEEREVALETAIKQRMASAAVLQGQGWRITWKRTRDVETTDWKSLATGLLTTLAETERTALVGVHTSVRAGFRPFRLVQEGDPDDTRTDEA